MRLVVVAAATVVLCLGVRAADSADSVPDANTAQELFNRTRATVVGNLKRIPRYTCVETVNREVRRTIRTREACSPASVSAAASSPGLLMWHDRLRLDIAVIDGAETFSWAGARRFETEDVNDLVGGGATGTGDFSGFLASIFGNGGRNFRYTGEQNTPAGRVARFDYDVPRSTTRYRYRTRGEFKITPYSGWFLVDPATADLERLVVIATEFDPEDDVCRVEDTIDYQHLKIGENEFLLPRVSSMNAVYARGSEAINRTEYSACHEYSAQSTIRFEDGSPSPAASAQAAEARQPLPPGVHVLLALETQIDGDKSAAGDEVVAEVLNDAKARSGDVAVHRGDRFHGRIVRLEEYLSGEQHWTVALRFDSIVRNGIETPVSLAPLDDGVRAGAPRMFSGRGRFSRADPASGLSLERPPGSGLFVFFGAGKLLLNSRFHSSWVTSAPDLKQPAAASPAAAGPAPSAPHR